MKGASEKIKKKKTKKKFTPKKQKRAATGKKKKKTTGKARSGAAVLSKSQSQAALVRDFIAAGGRRPRAILASGWRSFGRRWPMWGCSLPSTYLVSRIQYAYPAMLGA